MFSLREDSIGTTFVSIEEQKEARIVLFFARFSVPSSFNRRARGVNFPLCKRVRTSENSFDPYFRGVIPLPPPFPTEIKASKNPHPIHEMEWIMV